MGSRTYDPNPRPGPRSDNPLADRVLGQAYGQPYYQGAQAGAAQFVQGLFGGNFQAPTNPLLTQANANLQQLLGGQMPEEAILRQLSPFLSGLLGPNANSAVGVNPFAELQFANEFSELQNPFGSLGAFNQGERVLAAAAPTQARLLGDALTRLEGAAPGRFSSALAAEGRDLSAQALQDYGLFAQQTLQQGLSQQLAEQQAALNFSLGARGLQQEAVQNVSQNRLTARGLQQEGELGFRGLGLQGSQQQIAAAQLLGSLAGQAGDARFSRQLGAGQFAQSQINPIYSLLLGGLQFGAPSDTIFDPGIGRQILEGLLGIGAGYAGARAGGGGRGTSSGGNG